MSAHSTRRPLARRSTLAGRMPWWLLVLAMACSPPRAEVPDLPPFDNLVVIMIDTLRSDHLPSYGYPRPTAPYLSRLSEEGIQLQGYSASSWTRPSIATLLTGLYPQRHRTTTHADVLPESLAFLPEILADSGFATAAYVSNPGVGAGFGFGRGFEHFSSMEVGRYRKLSAAEVTDRSLSLVERLQPRFFLYVHYLDPHAPYTPEEPWGGPADPALPVVSQRAMLEKKVPKTPENIQRLKDLYDGAIHELDRAIERLLASLDERGALDDTLVVVTADHGEAFGEHHQLGHGLTLFEEEVQVPFILWSRREMPSYRSPSIFHQVEFLPTILAALGLESPAGIDGRSRWPEILGGELEDREYLLSLDLNRTALGLLAPPFKLIHRIGAPTNLLFELPGDRAEKTNRTGDDRRRATLLRRLIQRHNALAADVPERQIAELDLGARERLAALGYLQVDTPQEEIEAKKIPDRLVYYDSRVFGLFAGLVPSALATDLDLSQPSGQLLRGWIRNGAGGGRWSRPTASFALPVRPGYRRLELAGELLGERRLARCAVRVNDRELDEFEVTPGSFEVAVALPEEVLRARMAYVELEVRPPARIDGTGPKAGLFWRRLAVR